MIRLLRAFASDASAATAVEYAFIAAFVSVAIVAGVTQIGTALTAKFNNIGNHFS